MPLHPVALELLERTGPLAVSSANTTGDPAALSAEEAREMLGGSVAVYLDGGPCLDDLASTIVDCTGPGPVLLRAGAVPEELLREVVPDGWDGEEAPQEAFAPARAGARHGARARARAPAGAVAGTRRPVRAYLLVMAVAAVVTFLTTSPVRGVAVRLRALSPVRDRDVHSTPVPRLGGVAILAGFAAALGLAATVPFLPGTFGEGLSGPVGILLAAAVITVVGVVDDLVGLDALTKFVGQALAGVVMATFGVQLLVLPIGVNDIALLSGWVLTVLTVLVVVVTVNAVNFVDGLDGLAAGVVAIAGTAFFAYSYLLSREASPDDLSSTASLVTAATVGACVGFLPHNLHPARIFMGDSGRAPARPAARGLDHQPHRQHRPGRAQRGRAWPRRSCPCCCRWPPSSSRWPTSGLAVLRRTAAGRSPFAPDKQHLHHRMLEIGHGHRAAVALLHAWVALLAFGVVATAFWPWRDVLVVAGAVTVVVAVLTVVPLLVRRVSRMPVTPDGDVDDPPRWPTARPARPAAPSRPARRPRGAPMTATPPPTSPTATDPPEAPGPGRRPAAEGRARAARRAPPAVAPRRPRLPGRGRASPRWSPTCSSACPGVWGALARLRPRPRVPRHHRGGRRADRRRRPGRRGGLGARLVAGQGRRRRRRALSPCATRPSTTPSPCSSASSWAWSCTPGRGVPGAHRRPASRTSTPRAAERRAPTGGRGGAPGGVGRVPASGRTDHRAVLASRSPQVPLPTSRPPRRHDPGSRR